MSLTDAPVSVVGSGAMGSGIAQVAAMAGHPVTLVDAVTGAAEAGVARIIGSLQRLEAKALSDWKSETEMRLLADKAANEQKAVKAGKPLIKPALKRALTFAKKTCKLNLNLPK